MGKEPAVNDVDFVYTINNREFVLVRRTFDTSYADIELRKIAARHGGIIVDNKDSGWSTGFLKMLIPSTSVEAFNKESLNL